MSGLDLSRLSPGDAVAALRSYPRRYRALLFTFDEDERPDDVLHRPGPDGRSALDHAAAVATALGAFGRALEAVLIHDRPVLPPGAGPGTAAASTEAVLDQVTLEAQAIADTAAGIEPEAWRRVGLDRSGREVTAFDIVKDAVRTGSDGLRTIERTLAHVR